MVTRLRLADLLAGLSIVADMGYGLPVGEAMRSSLIGVALARRLGLAEREVADTFYTSLLFHVGCVTFSHDVSAVFGDEYTANRALEKTNVADRTDIFATLIPEVTRGLPPLARARTAAFVVARGRDFGRRYATGNCDVARHTAHRIGLPGSVQRALYQVHEWWNGGGDPHGLKGEEILIAARIARVASDAARFDAMGDAELAGAALRRRADGMLDPSLVAEFVANAPALLAQAHAGDPRERILAVEPEPVVEKDEAALVEVAAAFGDLADLKTPFTHGHSRGVAGLAKAAAERLALDAPEIGRLHVAAFLHDLGRVGVANAIWEKPAPLTSAEWEQVRLHPYHTERILATSRALAPMALIAGMHHERLDGSGYHRGCRGRDLTPAARVLATADAFQAMTEPRPHREARSAERAADELRRDARAGRLDPDAVTAVIDAAGQHRAGRRRDPRPAGLSDREIEVLRLVTEGCSNPQIARRLSISPRTAEHHVQHIYTKIGVSTRVAATLFALDHDLILPLAER